MTLETCEICGKNPGRRHIYFKTEDGTYIVSIPLTPDPDIPNFAIFNGVGSGKTIDIKLLEIQEVGDDSLPYFTIEKIDNIGSTVITPSTPLSVLKFDTANPDIPSQVIIRPNCIVKLAGYKFGAIMSNPSVRRQITPIYGIGSTTGVNWRETAYVYTPLEQSSDSLIVLKEGQGMAIIKKSGSSLARVEMAIDFTTEQIPTLTPHEIAKNFPQRYVKTGSTQELASKVS